MITKRTIEKVFDTARVEEVIGDFVNLKKSGSNFKGLSPFSEEKTPSFMVSPVKQIWKDFSSGKGGNAVSFIMEHEHYSYPEAIRYLAKKYNIEIEETEQTSEEKEKASERESMFLVSKFANQFFIDQLHHSTEGQTIGLSYFKERGFTTETIKKFDLGYSPDQWEALTKAAINKAYEKKYLEATGLTITKDQKSFDRFKGRVMFPIHSMSGRVLGFGGRILDNSKKAAKYLNSPESEIYHKSKILYGLYYGKKAIAQQDNCYLVEGYTDVIQLHQAGIENVVSSSGTALTDQQIRLINRLTKNITVLFDGDAAGLRASLRSVNMILAQDMNVKVCMFPEGEDPDSFAKANSTHVIEEYLETNAKDFITFKASLLIKEAENDPIKTAEVIRDIVESIAQVPDQIKRELYIRSCSKLMDVSEAVLFSSLDQILAKSSRDQRKKNKSQVPQLSKVEETTTRTKKINPKIELERIIIGLLLKYGDQEAEFEDFLIEIDEKGNEVLKPIIKTHKVYEKIYLDLQSDEIEFTDENFKLLYHSLIDGLSTQKEFNVSKFTSKLDQTIAEEATSILMNFERYELHNWESQNIFVKHRDKLEPAEVTETILNLRRILIHQKVDEMGELLKSGDHENPTEVLEETMEYKQLEVLIARKLNRII